MCSCADWIQSTPILDRRGFFSGRRIVPVGMVSPLPLLSFFRPSSVFCTGTGFHRLQIIAESDLEAYLRRCCKSLSSCKKDLQETIRRSSCEKSWKEQQKECCKRGRAEESEERSKKPGAYSTLPDLFSQDRQQAVLLETRRFQEPTSKK